MSQQIEHALFGDERAPTSAGAPRAIGKIRAAEGGTLFLDDSTELPAELQVRLLRLLQQKEIEPSGGGRPVKVNVRIITAAEDDLRRAVQAGRFREDLYFRLNVLPIPLTSLRERTQDILPLAEHFIQRISVSDRLPLKSLTADAQAYLMGQPWPGNVRELEGLIHRALVLSDAHAIDREVLAQIHDATAVAPMAERAVPSALHIRMNDAQGDFKTMAAIEYEAMRLALDHFQQNITHAADALGIAKSTFYRKMKQLA
jgi:two-component system response regulator FlrC